MKRVALLFAFSSAWAGTLWFEPNQGQAHASVQFLSKSVYLGAGRVAIHAGGDKPVVMDLIGANAHAPADGVDRLPGISNYYLGNDPRKWRSGVPHYARVRYRGVYPGIDVIFYGNTQGKLEYDFIVGPGADPAAIRIAYNRPVRADSNGDLLIARLRQLRPRVYQDGREVTCDYIVDREHHIRLALGSYDHTQELTVDPSIEYSTYLGGNGDDFATGIAVDAANSAYIVGSLESPQYPSLDPFQQESGTVKDIVVAKFTPFGNALVFYTYIGGSLQNNGQAIAVDASSNTYITGSTSSLDFPAKNAAQPTFGGGYENAIVVKLSSSGTLVYSTFLGGNNQDVGYGITLASDGAAFVTGFTYSANFPVRSALQPVKAGGSDAFLAKLSPAGDQFQFATFLGGSGLDAGYTIALDANGNPIVVGKTISTDFPVQNPLQTTLGASINGFITKVSSVGDKLLYSTYFGAAAVSELDFIALDNSGAIYVCGYAHGDGLPVKNAIQPTYGGGQNDLLLAKLTPVGDSILYATYLGGSNDDGPAGLVADRDGNVYVAGATSSTNFPVRNSLQPFVGAISATVKDDAFVAMISSGGVLLYSTIIGGNGDDRAAGIALDSLGAVHVVGITNSTDFPTKNPLQATFGGGRYDMFYLRLAPETLTLPSFTTNPGSLQFRFVQGGSVPGAQTVAVSGGGSFTAKAADAWLSVAPASGTTPATLNVSVNPSGLTPQVYSSSVQVTPSDGSAAAAVLPVNLNVLASAPQVTAVSPADILVGSEATTITITGSGFVSGSLIESEGSALATQFVDSTTLQLTLDKSSLAQPFTFTFMVVNPQSAASQAIMVTVGTAAPQVTSVSPSEVRGPGSTTLTITGSGFVMGAVVELNGRTLKTQFVDAATLRVTVDGRVLGKPGNVSLTVVNPGSLPSSAVQVTVAGGVRKQTPRPRL